ncbi:hypothetical protein ACO0LB_20155 [Undibacterium sp. SXout7W]|uniref:hypothetical protein n=1 Tax=Undibacterium sp. SXout7W TaxID=3413049 RepID=UPI003BF22CAE
MEDSFFADFLYTYSQLKPWLLLVVFGIYPAIATYFLCRKGQAGDFKKMNITALIGMAILAVPFFFFDGGIYRINMMQRTSVIFGIGLCIFIYATSFLAYGLGKDEKN